MVAAAKLMYRVILELGRPPWRGREISQQFVFVAYDSAPVVLLCLCFAATVTLLEASFHMKLVVQNDALVPGFAALLILREVGVVVPALLLTARVGAGYAAQVATMQITEQIDALKMLGVNPIRYLVVPRFVACVLGTVVLTVLANCVCLLVAMWVSEIQLGYTSGNFLTALRTFVRFQDMVFSLIKGAAFGAIIPIVSCAFGFRCRGGAESVGLATTNSVVVASILIILVDFVLSWMFSYLY